MDVAAPAPPEPLPPPPGSGDPPEPAVDRVLGGVAGLLGARLGVDPLWVRLAFVLLALAGGIGFVVYGGLWLTLVVGASPDRTLARYTGGALIVVGVPLLLGAGSFDLLSGPLAVLGLLVGLTVALWQPRPGEIPPAPVLPERPARPGPQALGGEPGWALRRRMVLPAIAPRPPRARSILGRLTLGLAVVTGAVGALIDEANGGRLHPEQWLGAAAGVCGLGLVVGAFRGRARWLALPAAAFAASGFVAGVAAEAGVGTGDLFGDRWVYVHQDMRPGRWVEEVAFGTVHVDVTQAPAAPVEVVAEVGIGSVYVTVADGVTVEVRGRLDDGEIRVDGVPQPDDPVVVGPEGEPDVVVDASIERGSVEITRVDAVRIRPVPEMPPVPPVPELPSAPEHLPDIVSGRLGRLQPIADGVDGTADGWIVLAGGEAVIDPDDRVIVGEAFVEDESSITISTSLGDYRLLPRSILLAPSGEVLDLAAIRDGLAAAAAPDEATEPTSPAPDRSIPATTSPTATTNPGG